MPPDTCNAPDVVLIDGLTFDIIISLVPSKLPPVPPLLNAVPFAQNMPSVVTNLPVVVIFPLATMALAISVLVTVS